MSVIIKSGDTNSLAHVETDGSVFVKVTGSVTPTGGATEAKQDLQNTKLDSIATKLDGIKVEVSMDTAGIDTRLDTLHADLVTVEGKQDTGNASLASIDTKVSTAAKQDTGNTSLGSIDTKLTSQATTANQASANTKLDTLHADNLVIEGKLDTVNTNLTTLDTDLKASQPRKMQDGAGNPLTSTLGALDVNIKSESIIINTDDLIPSSDGVMTYGFDGTNPQKIKVDVTGQPQTVVTASALPSGAATSAKQDTVDADLLAFKAANHTDILAIQTKQDTGNTSLASIDTKLSSQATAAGQTTMSGKLDTLHADLVTVEGKQDTGNASLASIATNTNGSATAANQATEIAKLTSLDTKLPSQGQALKAASVPVTIASDQPAVNVGGTAPAGSAPAANPISVSGIDGGGLKRHLLTDIAGRLEIDTIQSLPLPSGAATATNQATMNTKLDTLHTDLVTVEGKQDTGNASLGSIDTKLSSQATAAGQTTINSNLATIDSDIKASQPRKMQDGAGAALTSTLVGAKQSLDVNIAGGVTIDVQLSQTNDTVQIYGNDGTTNRAILTDATGKIQVGVTSSALPTGAATESTLSALNTKVTTTANGIKVDGSAVTQPVSGSVSVSNFPATQPVSGTVTANIGTTNGLALDSTVAKDSSLTTLNTSVNSLLKPASTLAAVTTLGSITNTVTIKADTPVNQANALKVDGSAITQPISAVALPLPSGAATSALQTSGNASLSSIDSKTPALGQALAAASVPVVLTAAQLNTLTPLTAVTANIGTTGGLALDSTVAKDATLTNGTQKSVLRSATKGTTSAADVTSTNFDANTQALDVSIKGTVSTTLSGTPAVSVSNFPAVQAVSQSSKVVNSTVIGTFTASDAVVAAPIGDGTLVSGASTAGSIISLVVPNGYQSWTLLIKGYVSGTIYTESSSNSTNGTDGDWIDIKGRRTGTTPGVESVTYAQVANGYYRGNASGFTYFRCRLIGATGPLVNISLADSTGAVFLNSGIPTGGSVIGKVSIDQTTPGTTNLVQVSNFPAVQAVSATSLPLPTGAATAANQATMNTSLGSIDTKLTSQATAANQATMNTSLSSIDTKTPALVGGRQPVESSGNVASGTADSGNPIKVSGVYNAIPPNLATGQRGDLQVTPNGRLITVVEDGAKSTYSAAVQGLNIANSATDIFTITGSATKTVRITKIGISGTQTTGMLQDLLLIKRSSAPVGGTSTTPAIVSYDSNSAAGTAVARAYTSNPTTLGTSIGIIKVAKLLINQVSGGPGGPSSPQDIVWTFGAGPSQALVLRGIAQQISINYNGQTSAGSSFDLFVEWTEE